ncbi:MAG: phosphoribosylaminoimidazolesuccinocarboxamide synthase [bacterium]
MSKNVVLDTNFEDLKLFKKGKVRNIYNLGETYLIVSTDRLSAFDVIMNQGIPEKGKILNQISEFWFDFTNDIIENHLISTSINDLPDCCKKYKEILEGRFMIVKKAELIPMECIVRGYITGSGWNDYQKTGKICGINLPEGLSESEKLKDPIFTPSSKADVGVHDENIDYNEALKIVDEITFEKIKNTAISIYLKAAEYALKRGIIIADTKMEFGLIGDRLILIDEVLTPDSSRFWNLETYKVGTTPESYDKQFVRDYLLSINYNKKPPAPYLPPDIINNTSKKYLEALFKLTGKNLE